MKYKKRMTGELHLLSKNQELPEYTKIAWTFHGELKIPPEPGMYDKIMICFGVIIIFK